MTKVLDQEELTAEQLVPLLRAYCEARTQREVYGKQTEQLGALIKAYLQSHPGEVLWDGETRMEARLQMRAGVIYDLVSIRAKNPVLFDRLADLGCLTVDSQVLKAQLDQLPGVEDYRMPGRATQALMVEQRPG